MTIDERVIKELQEVRESLGRRKRLATEGQLDQWYATFRERFSPNTLARYEGADLLHLMHSQPRAASEGQEPNDLIYWLDRKRGDSFPSSRFGLLRSGAAAMNGPYFNKTENSWMARTAQTGGRHFTAIDEGDAIEMVCREREELLAAVQCLAEFPETADPDDYVDLQKRLDAAAPAFSNSSWGHKYLSLLFPEIVDSFHGPELQWFHVAKLLTTPPSADARRVRYILASAFRAAREQSGMSRLQHLTDVLMVRNGARICDYWVLDTASEQVPPWQSLFEKGSVALDARAVCDGGALKKLGGPAGGSARRKTSVLYPVQGADGHWALGPHRPIELPLSDGDVIVVSDGGRLLGVGRVVGEMNTLDSGEFPIRAAVEWHGVPGGSEWRLQKDGRGVGLRTRVAYHENVVEIERHLLYGDGISPAANRSDLSAYEFPSKHTGVARQKRQDRLKEPTEAYDTPEPAARNEYADIRPLYTTASPVEDLPPPPPLTGMPARAERILRRKGQLIFYGPPGTGKSYWAEQTARELAARSWFGREWDQLSVRDRAKLIARSGRGAIRTCCFHPAYGYEDFLEGYRPDPTTAGSGDVRFERRDGVFKTLCSDAADDPEHDYFLIIDEINRGDVPRIFGELLAVMEKGKRGKAVLLPLTGEPFAVPENVFLIGTMNTADRSIALLDAALRRRFGFIELLPDMSLLEGVRIQGVPLASWLRTLNERIARLLGPDGRHIQVGHAYFLEPGGEPVHDLASLTQVLRDDVIPLLEEYCYEDPSLLEELLGSDLIDGERGRVREELFTPERENDLLRALRSNAGSDVTPATPEIRIGREKVDRIADDSDEDASRYDL